jgi:large subunit ribosomal protein L31
MHLSRLDFASCKRGDLPEDHREGLLSDSTVEVLPEVRSATGNLRAQGQDRLKLCRGEEKVKENIHPNYIECQVACACGAQWVTRSTKKEIQVEICSSCHPFYTGKQKLVDTAGRVERFQRKYGKKTEATPA